MTRIADLLDRDFSKPVEELVEVTNDNPDTVFSELTEYVATDRIKAEYERLLSAMAAASKSPNEDIGVWISGFFGSGKSSFAKNLGYVLANREVLGAPASSFFLKQVESRQVAECIEFLNRAVPCEIFMVDIEVDLPAQTGPAQTNETQIAEVMYRVLLRDLDYAEDYDIADLEIELEKKGKLVAFQDLCCAEYKDGWRKIRQGSQKLACSSALLHRLDPRAYPSRDTWLNLIKARPSTRPSVEGLVKKLFDLCEIRRHGKSFAFIIDELGQYVAPDGERVQNLHAVIGHFGNESLKRVKAGKIPGPAWIIATGEEKLQDLYDRLAAGRADLPQLQDRFKHLIDLSPAGIRDVAARRVLRKKESEESILRKLFRDRGASLMQNIKLERCSRRTEFDEEQFVRFYPYLPHFIDLSVDIMAGIRLHPNAPKHLAGSNRTVIRQAFEMLVSDRTRLADQPVGVLVSIDRIYDLVEANIPPEKQQNVIDLRLRFNDDKEYPGLAARVAKAISLMEFAKTDLPRTTKNIAALLVRRVNEAPPEDAVAAILEHMEKARFVRETEDGWTLDDFDELRRATAPLHALKFALGTVNPRLPGWHNDLIQLVKKLLAGVLTWYTRPLREFSASVTRSLEETVRAFDRLSARVVAPAPPSTNIDALDSLPMDIIALQRRLALLEKRLALSEKTSALSADTCRGSEKTTYLIGLFGTGRRYVNELILQNIGERAKYFKDTIRLHPGPTPMIYSGHATMKHVSCGQELPTVMKSILETVKAGFADLIFVYRHPLDSLLTNWVWWRTCIRDNRSISGISQIYRNTDELCADLEQNFSEFEAFAEGNPDFFAALPGPRFLSFAEFVEETELHIQAATLTLRLEDFMIDPSREFSKIVQIMSVDLDLSRLCVAPPRTRPYGHLAVHDKVPRFRTFINELDAATKRRIEKIGYSVKI